MNTVYEVECTGCGKLKWPTLPERPDTYLCVLCRMVTPEKRAQRVSQAQQSARTRKARQKSREDTT